MPASQRWHQCGSGGSLSVWVTTQVYNKVPAPVRKCASQLVMYETRNRMELDSLYNEVIVGLNKAEWYQLCKYVWDKKFQFLFLDTTRPFQKMYHKNFNQLELHGAGRVGGQDGRLAASTTHFL